MVGISHPAAGPVEQRHLDVPVSLDNIQAHAVFVGDGGILSHKQAAVDDPAGLLDKLAVQFPVDFAFFLKGVDGRAKFFSFKIPPATIFWDARKRK